MILVIGASARPQVDCEIFKHCPQPTSITTRKTTVEDSENFYIRLLQNNKCFDNANGIDDASDEIDRLTPLLTITIDFCRVQSKTGPLEADTAAWA